jgi:hypothetical protein
MMALRKNVILRSPRSGRLEGRKALLQFERDATEEAGWVPYLIVFALFCLLGLLATCAIM